MRLWITLLIFSSTLIYAGDQALLGFGFGSGRVVDYKKTIHTKLNYTQLHRNGLAFDAYSGLTIATPKAKSNKTLVDFEVHGSVLKYFSPYASLLPYAGAHFGIHFLSDPYDFMMLGYGLKAGIMIKGLDPYLLRLELCQSAVNNANINPILITMSLERPLKKTFFRTDKFIKRRIKSADGK